MANTLANMDQDCDAPVDDEGCLEYRPDMTLDELEMLVAEAQDRLMEELANPD